MFRMIIGFALAAAAVTGFAATFVFGESLTREDGVSPEVQSFLRFAIAGLAMLIVGGVMIGYICTAVTDFVVTFAADANIVNLHNWSKGCFSGIFINGLCNELAAHFELFAFIQCTDLIHYLCPK